MSHLLPSYLHTLRKQWGLSQSEFAALFGITVSALSRFETTARRPTVNLLLATEVIFGQPARKIFPALYEGVEDKIMRRARILYERLEKQTDLAAVEKLRLLTEMIDRADPATPPA